MKALLLALLALNLVADEGNMKYLTLQIDTAEIISSGATIQIKRALSTTPTPNTIWCLPGTCDPTVVGGWTLGPDGSNRMALQAGQGSSLLDVLHIDIIGNATIPGTATAKDGVFTDTPFNTVDIPNGGLRSLSVTTTALTASSTVTFSGLTSGTGAPVCLNTNVVYLCSAGLTGLGILNRVAVFTAPGSLGSSSITDDGSTVSTPELVNLVNEDVSTLLTAHNILVQSTGTENYGVNLILQQSTIGGDGQRLETSRKLTSGVHSLCSPTDWKNWSFGSGAGSGNTSWSIYEDADAACGYGTERFKIAAGGAMTVGGTTNLLSGLNVSAAAVLSSSLNVTGLSTLSGGTSTTSLTTSSTVTMALGSGSGGSPVCIASSVLYAGTGCISSTGFISASTYCVGGLTDYAPCLNTAISAAAGKALWIPAGLYPVAAMLSVPSNTMVFGDGPQTIIKRNASIGGHGVFDLNFITNARVSNLKIDGNTPTATGMDYATVKTTYSGNPTNAVFVSESSVFVHGSSNITLDRLNIFETGGQAIYLECAFGNCENITVSNNLLQDCHPFLFGDASNKIFGAWPGGILYSSSGSTTASNILFIDNIFERVAGNGIWGWTNAAVFNRNITIARNQFRDMGLDAIQPSYVDGLSVVGNIVDGAGYVSATNNVPGSARWFNSVGSFYGSIPPVAFDHAGANINVTEVGNVARRVNGGCFDLDGFTKGYIGGNRCSLPMSSDPDYSESQPGNWGPYYNVAANVNASGTTISGSGFLSTWVGGVVTVGGLPYVVSSVSSSSLMFLTTSSVCSGSCSFSPSNGIASVGQNWSYGVNVSNTNGSSFGCDDITINGNSFYGLGGGGVKLYCGQNSAITNNVINYGSTIARFNPIMLGNVTVSSIVYRSNVEVTGNKIIYSGSGIAAVSEDATYGAFNNTQVNRVHDNALIGNLTPFSKDPNSASINYGSETVTTSGVTVAETNLCNSVSGSSTINCMHQQLEQQSGHSLWRWYTGYTGIGTNLVGTIDDVGNLYLNNGGAAGQLYSGANLIINSAREAFFAKVYGGVIGGSPQLSIDNTNNHTGNTYYAGSSVTGATQFVVTLTSGGTCTVLNPCVELGNIDKVGSTADVSTGFFGGSVLTGSTQFVSTVMSGGTCTLLNPCVNLGNIHNLVQGGFFQNTGTVQLSGIPSGLSSDAVMCIDSSGNVHRGGCGAGSFPSITDSGALVTMTSPLTVNDSTNTGITVLAGSSAAPLRLWNTDPRTGSRNWDLVNAWSAVGTLEGRVSNARTGDPISAGFQAFSWDSAGNMSQNFNLTVGGHLGICSSAITYGVELNCTSTSNAGVMYAKTGFFTDSASLNAVNVPNGTIVTNNLRVTGSGLTSGPPVCFGTGGLLGSCLVSLIQGSGTTGTLPIFTSGGAIGDSHLREVFGSVVSSIPLTVQADFGATGYVSAGTNFKINGNPIITYNASFPTSLYANSGIISPQGIQAVGFNIGDNVGNFKASGATLANVSGFGGQGIELCLTTAVVATVTVVTNVRFKGPGGGCFDNVNMIGGVYVGQN